MDPLGATQFVLSAINYLKTAADKVKENKNECQRLCRHAGSLLDLIDRECKDGIPTSLKYRLSKLGNVLLDLSAAIEELSEASLFRRIITRDSISSRIQSAYTQISDAAKELNVLGIQIDLRRFQQENEDARRYDADETRQNFERILKNGDDVLMELQIQRRQMQEAMLCMHQYLANLPQTAAAERQVLENGMGVLQRRSGPMKVIPDAFVITSFDIIVHHDKKLGEGGFATVYEADWKGTKVAVKELERGVPPAVIQQEIDVWKRLHHPHILQFFGACNIAEPAFIVCALQANGDIVNHLRDNPDAGRRKLLHDASLGLVYLHDNNIIHGDLKGTNILVDEHGRACIADFGLSRIKVHSTTIRRTTNSSQYGTLRWMSPEAMMLGTSNKKTDIYSFGMTMYEVFTGAPPFARVPDVTLISIVHDRGMRPPRPDDQSVLEAGLDDEQWLLITQCWAQKPEERLTAEDVAGRLHRDVDLLEKDDEEIIDEASAPHIQSELVEVFNEDVSAEAQEDGLSDPLVSDDDLGPPDDDASPRGLDEIVPLPDTAADHETDAHSGITPNQDNPQPSIYSTDEKDEPYSSLKELQLTFSPRIVRTPDHYLNHRVVHFDDAGPSTIPPRGRSRDARGVVRFSSDDDEEHDLDILSTVATFNSPRSPLDSELLENNYTRKRRWGYWNRRGDHLVLRDATATSTSQKYYVVHAPSHLAYPSELSTYPSPWEGWINHHGHLIAHDPAVTEMPESVPHDGKPPVLPYKSFVRYTHDTSWVSVL
ncbi:hypothetical protein NM688_g8100 [Phlebia brevispora]|uniref:Uncharacterized protein n=1 Tax=Phlebia brevispora TaxID=194682 RepID=A0ACC1RXC0_9APHY|nr:hypothetical protein NM688_g8100 [Phlebia brevispora]